MRPKTPSQTHGETVNEFERLSKKQGELVTLLSRMKVLAVGVDKRCGGSAMFVRTMTSAHDDSEKWGRLLREWSDASGGDIE